MDSMSLEQYMLPENHAGALPQSMYGFRPLEDMHTDRYVSMLMEIHRADNFGINHQVRAHNGCSFSITGGYCRNHMLDVQTITDIDVVANYPDLAAESFGKRFNEVRGNATIRTFNVPDNTLHLLPYPYVHNVNDIYHVFIEPSQFDFTVNLGCISGIDGMLYAPPITLFDIKNRILRPCVNSFTQYGPASVMLLSIMLRAIRFSLKYNMSIHESLLRAMDVLFAIQNYTKQVDDKTLYHTLKHVDHESEELKTQYYAALKILHFIDTDKYASFADYYKYVTDKAQESPRESPVYVETPRDPYHE